MTEKDFLKLVIDSVQADSYFKKDELVDLLKISSIEFLKTNEYTRCLWNHYKEYIIFQIIPGKLIALKSHKDYLESVCRELYTPNDEYELWDVMIRPGVPSQEEDVSQEIVFANIRSQIIEEIRKAKYLIWVVMAWFTDPVLFNELCKKKDQGVTVEIIVDDNNENRSAPFVLDRHFPTHWIRIETYYKNIMHEKFCIIDLKTAVHGSFNWSKRANYNKEHISIDHNKATAESFADEFMRLKNSN